MVSKTRATGGLRRRLDGALGVESLEEDDEQHKVHRLKTLSRLKLTGLKEESRRAEDDKSIDQVDRLDGFTGSKSLGRFLSKWLVIIPATISSSSI